MEFLILVWEFLKIGLLSYGGGYGLISYIQNILSKHDWISLEQLSDIIAISQITPGPIAVNISTYIGYSVGGIPGALVATLAMILPGFIIAMFMVDFISKHNNSMWMENIFDGLKAVVIALIISAIIPLGKLAFFEGGQKSLLGLVPLLYSVWASIKKKNVLTILGLCGIWGILFL